MTQRAVEPVLSYDAPVTEQPVRPGDVEFWEVRRLRLVRGAAPRVSPEHQLAMDRVWDQAVRANPTGLFDGPVVACAGLEWEALGSLVVFWTPVTYRHFALRRVPGAAVLPALYVAIVQPTDEGGLLVGRMSSSTAAPGRVQVPGGSVEPPEVGELLDEAALRRQAARELVEETGIDTVPEELSLWVVTRGEHRNVGVFFRAPPRPEMVVRQRFAAMASAQTALGHVPELQEIAFIRSPAEVARLPGPHAATLEPLVDRYGDLRHREGPVAVASAEVVGDGVPSDRIDPAVELVRRRVTDRYWMV